MKISEVKELIELINETDINELEFEKEDTKLILRKGITKTVEYQATPMPKEEVAQQVQQLRPNEPVSQPETSPNVDKANGEVQEAPMVGTFYRAPRPGADSFVKVGDRVEKGQTLCIIEAMKLMNEIEAEFTGKIVDILIEDGQPVEYGQSLFIIDPA